MSDISAPDHATETPDSQALVWFVRMNSGDATDAEHDEFGFWLRDDPDNLMAYQRLETLWRDLNDVPDPRPAAPSSGPVISRRGLLVGAAGAAACAGLVAVTGLTIEDVTALGAADYRTGTGERRTVVLDDGSAVQLDAETAISVDGGPALRQVTLLAGRASFNVVPDPDKPFDVVCAGGTVRALGTAFTVQKRPQDTVVAVEDHAVAVCLGRPGDGGDIVRLTAGERVTYGAGRLGRPASAEDGAETAWRRGRLVFRDRPLADVVADLNRYRPGRVVVWGDDLAALRVDGVFNIGDPDGVLDAIIRTLPVREARITPYLVVLRAA